MTLVWRICFSLAAIVPAASLAASAVSGKVDIIGVHGRGDDQHVAVWLEPKDEVPALRPAAVRMAQRHKEFRPHMLAVPVGTTVEFPNYDPIFHNAFSNIDGQPFDVGLYPPGSSRRVAFRQAGIVRVFCNIHQSMSAVIVVKNTPWITVTNDRGEYSIPGVPPGAYTLNVFYERATQQTLDALRTPIEVRDQTASLPPIRISGAGYIPVPHKDKYGRDYPAAAGEGGVYGGR